MARKFLKIECGECGNQQKIFSHPSTQVKCLVCNTVVAAPTGGKAEIQGKILQELEAE